MNYSNFDRSWYVDHYLDVKNSGLNPLSHFINYGKSEWRFPTQPEWFSNQRFKDQIANLTYSHISPFQISNTHRKILLKNNNYDRNLFFLIELFLLSTRRYIFFIRIPKFLVKLFNRSKSLRNGLLFLESNHIIFIFMPISQDSILILNKILFFTWNYLSIEKYFFFSKLLKSYTLNFVSFLRANNFSLNDI